jgi:hypothetical protein
MKNSQKGFVVPLLIAIIALLVIGGGVYIYENKKAEAPTVLNQAFEVSSQPSITILSPKKGEFWKMGQIYTISYSVNGNFGPITIKLNRYSDDSTLIQSIDVGTSETNTFVYKVPTTLEDTKGSAGMFKVEVYPATARELVTRSEYFSIIR